MISILNRIFLGLIKYASGLLSFQNREGIVLIIRSQSGSNTFALSRYKPSKLSDRITEFKPWDEKNGKLEKLKVYSRIFSARIIIDTHGGVNLKGLKSIFIETWHGMPLKAIGYIDKGITDKSLSNIERLRKKVDYIISLSPFYTTIINAALGLPARKYIITGYPRNDFLFSCKWEILKKIRKNIQKVVFYLPTFRRSRVFSTTPGGAFFSELVNVLNFNPREFNNFLRDNSILFVIKPHYSSADRELLNSRGGKYSNILFLTERFLQILNIDLYEILSCADILITDYSSVYFDFLLTMKPIIFIPTDIEKYRKERGFLLEPYDFWTPGPKVYTQKDLQRMILKLLSDPSYYAEEREKLKNIVHYYQDANSSERVWDFIRHLLDRG